MCKRTGSSNKVNSELVKYLKLNHFILERQKKHYVFRSVLNNKTIVMSKSCKSPVFIPKLNSHIRSIHGVLNVSKLTHKKFV